MPKHLSDFEIHYKASRFLGSTSGTESSAYEGIAPGLSAPGPSAFEEIPEVPDLDLTLYGPSQALFGKALQAAIKSSHENEGKGRVLPLQGLVDLECGTVYLGALTPRDASAIVFDASPLIEHKQKGLFEKGHYGPRITSYQMRYSEGPTAHQQMLYYAAQKVQVTADDTENKRGIAINIQVTDAQINITIDGKSLSINQTGQYLRSVHKSGAELTAEEARNDVLKASGKYSDLCERWVYHKLEHACHKTVTQLCKASEQAEAPQRFFSKAAGMEVSDAHLTDEAMAAFYQKIRSAKP